jgi:osmotically-inducible protein OsmY
MKTDSELYHDVLEALHLDPSLDASLIGVSIKSGVVSLDGCVSGPAEQWEAERVVQRVAGVLGVLNHLEVRPPQAGQCRDEKTAAR